MTKLRNLTTKVVIMAVIVAALVMAYQNLPAEGSAVRQGTAAYAQGQGVELTVYNQNIALVRDRRSFDLKQGVNEVRFSDVASQIDPTSVHFRSLTDPQGTSVLEQNYEYDIVGSKKLLQKYIDQQIELIAQDGSKYQGKLLSGADDIILQDAEGGIKVVRLAQVRQFNFPKLPAGLITRPSLVWLLDAGKTGSQDVEVTYMTNGVNWNADYVVQLNKTDSALDLNGWITLNNQSGVAYTDAKLKLVAGDINVAREPAYIVIGLG